jgi:hypothetical protein
LLLKELGVGAALGDAAVVEHQDEVRVHYRGKPVSDH